MIEIKFWTPVRVLETDRSVLNLDAFLALLSETAEPPAGINTSRLTERRALVRKVVSSSE